MTEEIVFRKIRPAGEYRDMVFDSHGELLWETPWKHNLIVDGFRGLLAALVKGDPQGEPVTFWAVGTGQEVWDNGTQSQPSDSSRLTLTKLYNETGRKLIPPENITFIGGSFTNRLEITTNFTTADLASAGNGNENWRLREFGLFSRSGVLVDHIVHPRIDMQDGFTLQRTLRLIF